MSILIFVCVICFVLFILYYTKYKRMYYTVEKMLDDIVEEDEIKLSDTVEGELSALVSKALRVQDKLKLEINQATEEKEELARFVSGLSHQLKTPLASIEMFEELLENPHLQDGDRAHLQCKLKNQTERLQWILNSLFKMINLEQNTVDISLEKGNIREAIIEAVGLIYEKAEKKQIELSLCEEKDIYLLYHRKWMVEVLVNILENAIKYTREYGCIEISIKQSPMYSCVAIRDNGIGIDKEEQLKIFKRFYRCREADSIEGSGIGLYLSKLIMEKQRGYITVDSSKGAGSCFNLYLQNCKN